MQVERQNSTVLFMKTDLHSKNSKICLERKHTFKVTLGDGGEES